MAEALPKWTLQKIFILVLVVVFFVSSFALTGLVVYEEFFKKDEPSAEAIQSLEELQAQQQEQPQTAEEQAKAAVEGAQSESNKKGEKMLQGTKLANFDTVDSVNELKIIDLKEGTGKEAGKDATITAHYTGASAGTGIIFESSLDRGEPFTSALSGLIKGWQEGIPGMKEGGKRRLLIPKELAYGKEALVFDIELITVK